MWAEFNEKLQIVRGHLDAAHLGYSVRNVDAVMKRLEKNHFLESSDLAGLEDNLERELCDHVFLGVAVDRRAYFQTPLKGWEVAVSRFPDCQEDVEEMNRCYALSRYTAAIFHSLLVVEHGLIALGKSIGAKDPKPGWDATYNQLGKLLKDRTLVPPTLDFNFLEQTKARLDSMKLAWRNNVNHAAGRLAIERTGFSDISAEEVLMACRSFMRHLAEGLPR